jgi:hypothetical protein
MQSDISNYMSVGLYFARYPFVVYNGMQACLCLFLDDFLLILFLILK